MCCDGLASSKKLLSILGGYLESTDKLKEMPSTMGRRIHLKSVVDGNTR